jgi:hypothetical protein
MERLGQSEGLRQGSAGLSGRNPQVNPRKPRCWNDASDATLTRALTRLPEETAMDRRILLRSLFAATGAAALVGLPKRGEAASIFDELSAVDLKGVPGAPELETPEADLPAPGAEDAQWADQPPWGGRRCRWTIDRFGRRVQVCTRGPAPRPRPRRCWWTVDRFGRRVRVCR